MSYNLSVNGQNYPLPSQSERNWSAQVNAFFAALAGTTLQKIGGSFTLSNEVDFGSTYGAMLSYIKSRPSNPVANPIATAGYLRLTGTDQINWKDRTGIANVIMALASSNRLQIGVPTSFDALASTDVFTTYGEIPSVGDVIQITSYTGTGPVLGTYYYVFNVVGDTFQLYTTPGGPTVLDVLTSGSGTMLIRDEVLTSGSTDTLRNKKVRDFSYDFENCTIVSDTINTTSGKVFQRVTSASPTPTLSQINLPAAGKHYFFLNATGADLSVIHNNGLATRAIYTPGGTTYKWKSNSIVCFLYDSTLTAWVMVGSDSSSGTGSGELNVVTNSIAYGDTLGWTGATRVATGSPLDPVITTAFSVSNTATAETNTSGAYFSITNMPTSLRSKRLKVEFWYSTPANDTYRVSVYQGSTRLTLIQTDVSGATTLPANTVGKFYAEFDTTTAAAYSVNVTRTAGTTGACLFTNVIVGPGTTGNAAIFSGWKNDLTFPVPTNLGTGTATNTAWYMQLANTMLAKIRCVKDGSGGSGTGVITFSMPSGLTIDQSKLPNGILLGNAALTGTNYGSRTEVIPLSSTTFSVGKVGAGNRLQGVDFTANGEINLELVIPIVEWGSGTVSILNQNTSSPLKAGIIQAFAGSTTPAGWLDCDGSTYSQTLYPQLYAAIGSTWATCVNATTGSAYSAPAGGQFRVPDLRNSFLRGSSAAANPAGVTTTLAGFQADNTARNGLTVTNNAVTTGTESATHTHTDSGHLHGGVVNPGPSGGSTALGGTAAPAGNTNLGYANLGTQSANHTHSVTSNVVLNAGDAETRPDNVGVKFIIKAWDDSFNLAGFAMADTAGNSGLVAAGKMPGQVTGAAIASTYVGETISASVLSAANNNTAATTLTNDLTLTAGIWRIVYFDTSYRSSTPASGQNAQATARIQNITDSATVAQASNYQYITNVASDFEGMFCGSFHIQAVVNITSTKVYRGQGVLTAAQGAVTTRGAGAFFAVRIS